MATEKKNNGKGEWHGMRWEEKSNSSLKKSGASRHLIRVRIQNPNPNRYARKPPFSFPTFDLSLFRRKSRNIRVRGTIAPAAQKRREKDGSNNVPVNIHLIALRFLLLRFGH